MTAKQQQAEIRRLNQKRRSLKAAPPGVSAVEEVQGHKRLSLSEIVLLLLQRQTRGPSGGVTLTRNAKGDTQIEVSVPTSEECPTIGAARVEAEAQYDALRAKYPLTATVVADAIATSGAKPRSRAGQS